MIDLCFEDISLEGVHSICGVKNAVEAETLRKYVEELFERGVVNWRINEGGSVFRRHSEPNKLDSEQIIHDMIELVRDIDRII